MLGGLLWSFPWSVKDPVEFNVSYVSEPCLLQVNTMTCISSDQVVEFSLEEVQATRVHKSRMLIGRLFSGSRLSLTDIRDAVNRLWQGQGRIIVRELKHGLLEFTLPSEATRTWVLQRTPWIVADRVLHLQAWIPRVSQRTFDELAIAPFRVQLWNVQEECCTHQFGRKIVSSTIGRVLEAGVFSCSDTAQKFIKVKALIDFSKPLRSQIMATNDEMGGFWIRFKYEFLPSFCFKCGRVGHARQTCTFDPPTRNEKFGPHMSTKNMGRKIFDGEELRNGSRRHQKSVWINAAAQMNGPGEEIGTKQPMQVDAPTHNTRASMESPKWMGTSLDPFLTTEAQTKKGKSPVGFCVTRSPKIALGRPTRRGKSNHEPKPDPMVMEGPATGRAAVDRLTAAHPTHNPLADRPARAQRVVGRPISAKRVAKDDQGQLGRKRNGRRTARSWDTAAEPIVQMETAPGMVGMSRHRRLILEDESEEEFVVREITSPTCDTQAKEDGGLQRGPMDATVVDAMPLRMIAPDCGSVDIRELNPRETKATQQSVPVIGLDRAKDAAGEQERKEKMEIKRKKGKEALVAIKAIQNSPPAPELWGSEDSSSEEKSCQFEVRRRAPEDKGTLRRLTRSNRVNQVVQAFEKGLAMSDLGSPVGELKRQPPPANLTLGINEYGSNIPDLEKGMKKRHRDESTGEIADIPTPKKQFMEEKEEMDKVEVASLEWPHPIK
ncbi:unnamed protein product [Linum trigynum]|uniref:CCHC-type domain-containing protein n=1 Tax=Linum trigynum TaxID=586398 RepID=A0AAV2FE79_9ROSI